MKRIQFTEDNILQLKEERLWHKHPILRSEDDGIVSGCPGALT